MRDSDVKNEIERMSNNRKETNMNERIKELAELSGFKVNWQHEDVQALKMARFEKFAELIVQDCIKELEISRRGDPYTGNLYDCEYNTCIGEQIQVLKARFGVE